MLRVALFVTVSMVRIINTVVTVLFRFTIYLNLTLLISIAIVFKKQFFN